MADKIDYGVIELISSNAIIYPNPVEFSPTYPDNVEAKFFFTPDNERCGFRIKRMIRDILRSLYRSNFLYVRMNRAINVAS